MLSFSFNLLYSFLCSFSQKWITSCQQYRSFKVNFIIQNAKFGLKGFFIYKKQLEMLKVSIFKTS